MTVREKKIAYLLWYIISATNLNGKLKITYLKVKRISSYHILPVNYCKNFECTQQKQFILQYKQIFTFLFTNLLKLISKLPTYLLYLPTWTTPWKINFKNRRNFGAGIDLPEEKYFKSLLKKPVTDVSGMKDKKAKYFTQEKVICEHFLYNLF